MIPQISKLTAFFTFSSDLTFLLGVFILFFVFAAYFGRGNIVSYILAFFPASFLYNTLPFLNTLVVLKGDKLILVNKLVIFLIFLLPLTIIINRYIFSATEFSGTMNLLKSLGFASAAFIVFMIFCYTTINIDLFHNFSPQIDILFETTARIFYWTLGVFAILAIL
jgi:hypothetical protein